MDDVREKLVADLMELANRTPPICSYDQPEETEIFGKKITVYCKPFEQFQGLLREAADYIANGVTVQTEQELVCVTKTGPSEAVYFRKIYFCPSCDTKIGDELLDVNTERVFGHGTVMRDNKFPKCCPECGTRIVMPTPQKGE